MTEKEMYQLIMSLKSQISTRTCDFAGKHIFQAGKGDEIHLMMKGKESTKRSDIMQIHEPCLGHFRTPKRRGKPLTRDSA